MKIRHVIATRLGIGVARPTFYGRHIAQLATTPLPALARQTSPDFEWVIAVDRFMDDASHRSLVDLLAPWPHFVVRRVDPFVEGLSPPLETILATPAPEADMVVVSRLDDDDAVGVDFVEQVAATVRERSNGRRLSIAFTTGLKIDPESGRFGLSQKNSIAIGLSVAAPAADPLNAYLCNHKQIHDYMAGLGGDSAVIRTPAPMWMHVRNITSVSNELSGGIVMPDKSLDARDPAAVRRVLEPALHRFALTPAWVDDITTAWRDHPDPAPAIIGQQQLRRLHIKRELLRAHKLARAKGRSTTGIENAFYMV